MFQTGALTLQTWRTMFMQFMQEKAESYKAFREEELKMRKREEETKAA